MDKRNITELEKNGWKKYQVISAKQPGGIVYQIAISGKDLANQAYVLSRGVHKEGIQRLLKDNRLKRINDFYSREDVLLPNNLVGSINAEDVYFEGDFVYISPEVNKEIIDGQHRLWAFHPDYNKSNADFDIFLAFIINADTALKAKLFYKINKEQKKIDPSLAFDLLSVINDGGFEQEVVELIKKLNEDSSSPFYNLIRMNENDEGILSLANMNTVVTDFLKTPTGRSFVVDGSVDEEQLYILFRNYFSAVKKTFEDQWEDKDSILIKTLGIGAFSIVLSDVINEYVRMHGRARLPRIEDIVEILQPCSDFNFKDTDIKGLGGKKGQSILADKLREELRTLRFG